MPTPTKFKRVAIGATFTRKSDGQRYRKVTGTKAFRVKANGVGETHNKLTFSRSCAVDSW